MASRILSFEHLIAPVAHVVEQVIFQKIAGPAAVDFKQEDQPSQHHRSSFSSPPFLPEFLNVQPD